MAHAGCVKWLKAAAMIFDLITRNEDPAKPLRLKSCGVCQMRKRPLAERRFRRKGVDVGNGTVTIRFSAMKITIRLASEM